ncbi:MAG: heparan-alpha-glucosaminide N-acetyltransferase domain-containing protein [Flavobacteriaceae bacterium]
MTLKTPRGKRISSIDMLRGLVMVIMALDHVRDYFHKDAFYFDPTDLEQTNVALFFTRFVTHFCAPVFVFLAGTSAFFVGQRRDKKFLAKWLLKRGVWLIFAEFTIIKLAWAFKLDFSVIMLQVIWVLGLGMIFLAAYIYLPRKLGLALALIVVLSHNLLDIYSTADPFIPAVGAGESIWRVLHVFGLVPMGSSIVLAAYPAVPWIFVMPLGYYFGALYKPDVLPGFRIKRLWQIGLGATLLFLVLRLLNIYGDLYPWSPQGNLSFTIMSFLNVTKYPPSLLFLSVTLGPSIIFLALAEKFKGWFFEQLVIIGRVPMFFYVVHLYVIHLLALIAAVAMGFNASDMIIDIWINMQSELQGYGFELWVVYLVWIGIVLALYPVCIWYNRYKSENRDKWWLSYL